MDTEQLLLYQPEMTEELLNDRMVRMDTEQLLSHQSEVIKGLFMVQCYTEYKGITHIPACNEQGIMHG